MPTLMTTTEVRKPHPSFPGWIPRAKGRCNAQCYDAKSAVCYCVCEGKNHGVGLKKAIENTQNLKTQGMVGVVFNDKVKTLESALVAETKVEAGPGKPTSEAVFESTKVEPEAKVVDPKPIRDSKGRFVKKENI